MPRSSQLRPIFRTTAGANRELAADYFSLRELDAEFNVVQESVGYQRKGWIW